MASGRSTKKKKTAEKLAEDEEEELTGTVFLQSLLSSQQEGQQIRREQ
jgi:hypothetical protein